MGDKRWKRHERVTAAAFGGTRTGPAGEESRDVTVVDGAWAWLCIECKDRKKLAGYIHDGMSQARGNARDGELPVVVLHERGQRHADDYVCVRRDDFIKWFGE